MWEGKKVAAYSATRNMYMFIPAAVKSLLTYSDVDDVWLLIEDDKFPSEFGKLPDCVHTRNLSKQRYLRWDGPNMKCGWTYMAMMRAVLCYEFPDLDRILSIDMDCLCCKDISDIYYFSNTSLDPSAAFILDNVYYQCKMWTNTGQSAIKQTALIYDMDKDVWSGVMPLDSLSITNMKTSETRTLRGGSSPILMSFQTTGRKK